MGIKTRPKSIVLSIRMGTEEHERFKKAAQDRHLKVSEWIRICAHHECDFEERHGQALLGLREKFRENKQS